jgi:hypothetical protein
MEDQDMRRKIRRNGKENKRVKEEILKKATITAKTQAVCNESRNIKKQDSTRNCYTITYFSFQR